MREVFLIVAQLRHRGMSILLIEQNARTALQVADQAYVLKMGRVTMVGPANELPQDPPMAEIYLGLEHAAA